MEYLYKQFDILKKMGMFNVDVPNFIQDNLKFTIRPYQTEAFQRYIFFDKNDFDAKPNKLPLFYPFFNPRNLSGRF